jgi:hypothetical protein
MFRSSRFVNDSPSSSFCLNLFAVSYKEKFLMLNGLQNLALARQQLKAARAAQMELIRIRERLLGQMAESVV